MSYICMVVDGEYPNDIRVRKEAEALADVGKKIIVVCPKKKGNKSFEIINGVEVFRIGSNYTFAKKGVHDIIESVININLFFYFGLQKVFKKYTIDFLHIHDLPLAGTGYVFKKKVTKKLILDLHENFPEALKTWFLWKKNRFIKLKNTLFMNPKIWSKKEQKYCNKYDSVICVVEEMKQKLIANFSINPEKLLVVSNHEKKTFATQFDTNIQQKSIDKSRFSITYVGGLGPHRGIDTAIKAMPYIVKKIPNAKLYVIGNGSKDVKDKLYKIAVENNCLEAVNFVGSIPFNEVFAVMKNSSINIIPHKNNEHTNNTIPHKIFQIMMSKSLLLVSSCNPLKRIVEKHLAGVVFTADDVTDFSEKVIQIYEKGDALNFLIENAYNAVMDKEENWENESLTLIEFYNNLMF